MEIPVEMDVMQLHLFEKAAEIGVPDRNTSRSFILGSTVIFHHRLASRSYSYRDLTYNLHTTHPHRTATSH